MPMAGFRQRRPPRRWVSVSADEREQDVSESESMDRIDLQPDLSLSRIVYGMWRLGDDSDTSAAHVQAKIEACLEQGITTMDQADIYGGYMAEEIMGAALKAAPGLR